MKLVIPTLRIRVACCALITLLSSCSKDTDLLADYLVADGYNALVVQNLIVNDSYIKTNPGPIILDVLSNDSFIVPDKVKIIKTSEPVSGTVTINEDKTITYIPNNESGNTNEDENSETPVVVEEKNDLVEDTNSETPVIEEEQKDSIEEKPIETPNVPSNADNDNEKNNEEPESANNVEQSDNTQETNEPEEDDPKEKPETAVKPTSDSFTYTVETADEEGNEILEEGVVDISYNYGELRAFPGAEGYGKFTTGGRGGKVYHVTNLNDQGSGSLREILEKKTGPRTVVFDVSGYINIKSPLKIRPGYGNVTIAGQTAPQGGVTIRGASVWIQDSEVIMRYISIRPGRDWLPNGPNANSVGDYEPDDAVRIIAFNGSHIRNIIFDHLTVSWGRDGIIDITTASSNASIKDITVQNTILSENVDKGYATLISGNIDNVTYYKNYIAHCSTRNIAMNALNGDVEFINNIIYGFDRGSWVKYSCRANLIGNVYFTNPNNPRLSETIRLEKNSSNAELTKIYFNDNFDDGAAITHNSRLREYIQNKPNQESGIQAIPSGKVKNNILPNVGSSIYRDNVDKRVIRQLNTLSGKFIKHENEVGGFPILTSINRDQNFDMDKDGMSDKWEIQNNFSSPVESDSHQDHNGDGFTDLEDYLHYLTLPENNNL